MSVWRRFTGSAQDWDGYIVQIEGVTYLHSSRWATHLQNLGWDSYRWHYQQNGKSIAFAQGFLKRYPLGVGVLWFPDWIAGSDQVNQLVGDWLKKDLALNFLYIRVRSHRHLDSDKASLQETFSQVDKPIDSGLTMHLNLLDSTDKLYQGLSKNWRRNLKRSNKLDYEIVEITQSDTVVELYQQLSAVKGLKELFSTQEINSLMQVYSGQIIVIGAKTPDGVVQAIRGAIIYQNQAIDIFAAANALARKHYLSYALCWDLLKRCQALDCVNFDFNGVDPEHNQGVYNFKKGTGAQLVQTLGEFEYSNSLIMRHLVNLAAKWRR